MEPHESDPTTDDQGDPWESFTTDFTGLGHRLRDTYRRVADDQGPSEEDIKEAFATLAGAWNQVAESVGSALKDPEVREQLKEAVGSFASAVGGTINDLGTELRRDRGSAEEE